MFKRKFVFSVLMSLGMLAASSAISAKQLKFGHYFATADFRGVTAQKFVDFLAEADPNLAVEIYPGESLVKGRDALQATSRGTVDLYSVYVGYISGSVDLLKVFTIPFPDDSYTDAESMQFANDERVLEVLDEALDKNNVKLLGFINSTGQTTAFLKDKLESLDDLKGLKIRGVGGYSDPALQELGASIVFMSAAEQFIQLETGGVDGVVTTDASYVAQDLARVAPAMLTGSVLRGPYALIMNKRAWTRLSDSEKAAVEKALTKTVAWSNENFAEEAERLAKAVNEGVQYPYTVTPEERERLNQIREAALQQFIEDHGEPAEKLADVFREYQSQ